MQTLYVELGDRRYPIFIGSQLDPKQLLEPYILGKQVMIVSNETVAPLYLAHYQDALLTLGKNVATCILPDGEKYKNIEYLNLIFDALLQAGFNRDCTVLALGGGVIGDMAGFASACFQRGVYFIQVPTTLLSQVDSSVGGKTGINHPLGKNMIGAFQQPQVVLADMSQLATLPERELSAGLAEVIKYALLQAGFNRDCTVLALGGGVIGDMAGFASACFQRGVYFIQVPTTLLSQVDSSVGGKTGINHPLGKNMIGAFQQPQVVLADMSQLATLPDRELSAGLAEVIKYALLCDEEFLVWLEANMEGLIARDETLLAEAVYRSCAHKARIVANDEKEQGERALLNLGHTFGHAIESYLGYGEWLHGEAVATGMVMAADLSQRMGWISEAELERTKKIISRAQLPIICPKIPLDEFLAFMSHDKKVLNGQLRLILLKKIGQAIITKDFDVEAMQHAILANQQ